MPPKSPSPQTNTCPPYAPAQPATSAREPKPRLGCEGGLLDDVHHQPHPDRQRTLVEVERRLMPAPLRTLRRPDPQPRHRASPLLQIPGEVLAAAGLLGIGQHIRADRL